MRRWDEEVVTRLLKACDLVVLASVGLVAGALFVPKIDAATPISLGFFTFAITLLFVFLLRNLGLYQGKSMAHVGRNLLQAIGLLALCLVSSIGLARISGLELSRLWFMAWMLPAMAYLAVTRFALTSYYGNAVRAGSLQKHIVIVGGGKAAEDTINTLERSKDLNINIVGLFDDRYDNRSPASIRKHKKLGTITDLAEYARINPVDFAIVAIPMSAEQRLLHILKRLWVLPIDIRISAQSAQLKLSPQVYSYLGELPLLSVFDRPLSHWSQFMKAAMDKIIAACAIIALAPVMLAVAVAVRYESKGPIIFRQKRFGFNNELIEVFKFRSMYVDQSDANAAKLVTKGDPRVTKVGRFIRKTSLDELPQLFNVLTGQLSLVGPRPHATQAKAAGTLYDTVVDGYFARHKVKPGITGWAQINGWRGETDTVEKIEQRVKHDLDYIDRWSLGFDFYILGKTPFALLKSENAY